MKNKIEEWLLKIGEINVLQSCAADVLENCMQKDEKPYYALTLINTIVEKTTQIYEDIDEFSIEIKQ